MFEYKILENKLITPSTLLLTLKKDDNERPIAFQPGQYIAIDYQKKNKKSVARCFSIVSSPTEQDILQVSMRVRGRFTSKISNLSEGTLVNVRGPFGGFIYNINKYKDSVFIAGGIGITPFMSMLRYTSKLNSDNKITLVYSVQTQDDIPFKSELIELEKKSSNIKIVYVIGHGPIDQLSNLNAVSGFVSESLLDKLSGQKKDLIKYFICGPPVFMKLMVKNLNNIKVNGSQILTEAFTQSSPKQSSILRSWPANVYTLGLIGLVLSGMIIMVDDLLRILPPKNPDSPSKNNNFYLTNARQKQIDSLVNSIPPSPLVINPPTTNKDSSTSNVPAQSVSSTPPTFSPIYLAPAPVTKTSLPPP